MGVCKMVDIMAYLPTLVLFWVLCLAQQPLLQAENSTGIINIGSVLTTDQNSSWISRNGIFALGFHAVGLHTYALSIWYAAIPVRTVIWTANRDSLVIEGATLSFRGDGNLVLMDSLEIYPVWETNTSSLNVFTAEVLDSGNFVLRNAQLDVVWDSFSNPSDTLMPDQKLSAGSELISDQTNGNAALGRYSLRQDVDGHLRLYYLPSSTWYWAAVGATIENSSYSDRDSFSYLNSSGFFAVYNSSASVLASWMTTDVGSGPLRHVKLGVGGDLRIYSWSEPLASWLVVWKALSDECSVVNLCGPYGLCSYEPDPICSCPPKFELVNPNDYSQGCQPPILLNCSTGSSGQKFLKLDNTQFGGDDYISLQGVSETDCMTRCAEDCACLGIFYFYNGNGTCSLKSQQQSGHVDPTGNSYIKVNGLMNLTADTVEKAPRPHSHIRSVRPEIVAVIVCGFSLACFLLTACCYHWWKEARLRHQGVGKLGNAVDFIPGAPTRFSFKDLQAATLNFSMKLGTGEFGTVYKGVLPDGTSVAVKQLESCSTQSHLADSQFRAEVAVIANTHHQNLVRLYGFCCEGSAHRLLVYEFMANGSLDKYVFSEPRQPNLKLAQIMVVDNSSRVVCLDWKKRFKVILGAARAIAYLHEDCGECIIHCDINPANIFLDDQFEAKVSDFGLFKLGTAQNHKVKEQTKVKLSTLRGSNISRGYLAPECLSTNSALLTTKSDVYSFGMVVLEVVSGRRRSPAVDQNNTSSKSTASAAAPQQSLFSEWGFHRAFTQREISELVDKNLGRKFNTQEAERAVKVAAWCVQDDPALRPGMGKVVHMLEGLVAVPSPSLPKPFQSKNLDQAASSVRTASDNEAVTPDALKGNIGDGILEFDLNSPLISRME